MTGVLEPVVIKSMPRRTEPCVPSEVDVCMARLSKARRALDRTKGKAQRKLAEGMFDRAAEDLKAARGRA